mmetsp:Transcript_5159/g.13448  ORF Transcript_5159/g.13448 Transcript_5159/m.13448 type:complete len:218 (+) Transcript_5159:578-1231(+)
MAGDARRGGGGRPHSCAGDKRARLAPGREPAARAAANLYGRRALGGADGGLRGGGQGRAPAARRQNSRRLAVRKHGWAGGFSRRLRPDALRSAGWHPRARAARAWRGGRVRGAAVNSGASTSCAGGLRHVRVKPESELVTRNRRKARYGDRGLLASNRRTNPSLARAHPLSGPVVSRATLGCMHVRVSGVAGGMGRPACCLEAQVRVHITIFIKPAS